MWWEERVPQRGEKRARRANFELFPVGHPAIFFAEAEPTSWPNLTIASAGVQERELYVLLREMTCKWCGLRFCVCRRCWRGQTYCCDSCRMAARDHAHREAQRRYRSTSKGREAHRRAERRRRMHRVKKTVADQSSIPESSGLIVVGQTIGCCHFCGCKGKVVEQFPRRGYARRQRGSPEGVLGMIGKRGVGQDHCKFRIPSGAGGLRK